MTYEIPAEADDATETALRGGADDLLDGSVAVTTHPNPHAPDTEVTLTVDFVESVDFEYVDHTEYGPGIEIAVELNQSPAGYRPEQVAAVYDVLDEHGVARPGDYPDYGVQIDHAESMVRVTTFRELEE